MVCRLRVSLIRRRAKMSWMLRGIVYGTDKEMAMMELTDVVNALMKALTAGGASAATDLFKGAVLGGVKKFSDLWHTNPRRL